MLEFIITREEPPEQARDRRDAADIVNTLQRHIVGLEDLELRDLVMALLDLAVAASSCLARSPAGTLNVEGYWAGMPPVRAIHVQAAITRLAMGFPSGTAGALACIKDANEAIRGITGGV
jgi:hypothetical protein